MFSYLHFLSTDDVHQGKADSKDHDIVDDRFSDDESNGDVSGYKDVQSNGFHELERDNSDDDDDDDNDDNDDDDYDNFKDDDDGDDFEDDDDVEDQNGNDKDDDMKDDEGEDEKAIKSFSTTSIAEDIEKGKAARNQLSMFW